MVLGVRSGLRAVLVALLATAFVTSPARAQDAPLEVTGRDVVVERERPQICFAFNQRLERPALVGYAGFVSVEPAVPVEPAAPVEVVVRDRSLCIEGPAHGTRVQITLRPGLPSATGADLRFAVTQTVEIPNRAPSVAFRGGGYLLSRIGPEGLDVRTVNVERLRFQVLRIADRALVERIHFGRLAQTMTDIEMGELIDRSGEAVWQADATVDARRNQPVQTAFPVAAAIAGLPSGIYIAAASDPARTGPAARATQWFVVSDLGLVSFRGEDGLSVHARRVMAGEPAAGVDLRLLSRAGREIARVRTGPDGLAQMPAAALGGAGDGAPQAVFAHAEGGDFAFLDLMAPPAPAEVGELRAGVPEAVVVTDRRTYGPVDTVHAIVLRRDEAGRAVAAGQRTIVRLLRPDGFEVRRQEIEASPAGGATLAFALPPLAMSGRWVVSATVAGRGEIGRAAFDVDERRPSNLTLDLRADRDRLDGADGASVLIDARYVYGAPGEALPGEISLTLRAAEVPFPDHSGFRFGLAQTPFEPQRRDLPGFTTDGEGRARAAIALGPVPETTHPLEAAARATVVDVGGRSVTAELALPVVTQPFFLGVRPLFEGEGVPEGATAGFEVIAVGRDGGRIAREGLRYEIFEESFEFSWFEAGGRWDYRRVVKDRRVGGGELSVAADASARIDQTVPAGRYRLEVFDGASGAATSVRFAGGWWAQAEPTAGPDRVDVVAMLPAYRPGETAWIYIRPPWRAQVLIAVADRQVRRIVERTMGPEGGILEVPIEAGWTTGMNLIATAFPIGETPPGAPRRAAGLGWIGLDPAARTLDVALDLPPDLRPGATVEVPVRVAGIEPDGRAEVALFVVDDDAAAVWDDRTTDPAGQLFGPRRPAVEIRDVFGRLSDPVGSPQVQPPAASPPWEIGEPMPTFASGSVSVGPDGVARIPVTLAQAEGRVRLVAIAWTVEKVGRARATAVLRDPVALRIEAPRFLAPDDRARVQVDIRNTSGPAGAHRLSVSAVDGIAVEDGGEWAGDLAPGSGERLSVTLAATAIGAGRLTVRLVDPAGQVRERVLTVPVRPSEPPVIRRLTGRLLPEQVLSLPADLFAGMRLDDVRLALSVAAGPLLPLPGLFAALDPARDGPPGMDPSAVDGSLSASGARVLASLSIVDAGGPAWGTEARAKDLGARSLSRMLALQRTDGAFAAWHPRGPAERWLTVFAVDVLQRAREAGLAVPEGAVSRGRDWIARMLENSWVEPSELPARAYAYLLLARAKAIEVAPVRVFAETWGPQLQSDLARAQVAAALTLLGDARRAQPLVEQVALRRSAGPAARDQGSILRDLAASYVVLAEANAASPERLLRIAEQLAAIAAEAPAYTSQEAAWLVRAGRLIGEKGGEVRIAIDGQPVASARPLHRPLDAAAPARVQNVGSQPLSDVVTAIGTPLGAAEPAQSGLTLTRRILDMDGSPVDLAQVRRNDLLVVVLEGRGREGETHTALLVDRIPAGFAVETVRTAGSAPLGGLSWVGPLSEVPFVETRDDGVVAALDLGPLAPTFRLVHVMRAVTPGRYAHPSARIEDLVRPSVVARTGAGTVTIGEQ
jgi:alpha-2-macroglobulin